MVEIGELLKAKLESGKPPKKDGSRHDRSLEATKSLLSRPEDVEAAPKEAETLTAEQELFNMLRETLREADTEVAADQEKVAVLQAETSEVLENSQVGPLEKGEANRLLGEVIASLKNLVDLRQKTESESQLLAIEPALSAPAPEAVPTLDLTDEDKTDLDLETEMMRLMADVKEPAVEPVIEEEKKKTSGIILEESVGPKKAVNDLFKEKMEKELSPEEKVLKIEAKLDESLKEADKNLLIAEKGLLERLGRKFYEGQLWLGEKNLVKCLGGVLEKSQDDGGFKKLAKGAGRMAARLASLRTVASVALLGGGAALAFAGGGGILAGAGVLGVRRAIGAIATYYGAHDGMKGWRDKANREKMAQKLSNQELQSLSEDDLLERMGLFEVDAKLNNKRATGNKNYSELLMEFGDRFQVSQTEDRLDEFKAKAELRQQKVEAKFSKKERSRKIIAGVLAAAVGGGSYLPSIIEGLSGTGGGVSGLKAEAGYFKLGPKTLDAATPEEMEIEPTEEISTPELKDIKPAAPAAVEAPAPAKPEIQGPAAIEPEKQGPAAPRGVEKSLLAAAEAAKHVEYQGGKSVWQEIEKQYQQRYPDFKDLPPGEKTYLIDQVENNIVDNKSDFGLVDPDKVTAEQLKSLNWDEAFKDAELERPDLTAEQIKNIEDYKAPAAETAPSEVVAAEPQEISEPDSMKIGQDYMDEEIKNQGLQQDKVELGAFIKDEFGQEWLPDKTEAFRYLYEYDKVNAATLAETGTFQEQVSQFNHKLDKVEELLKNNNLKSLEGKNGNGAWPALGKDNHTYLIEPKGNKWLVWRMGLDGQLETIKERSRIFFSKDMFSADKVEKLLGYNKSK